ncbi:MAG: lamin tail domain-containing protein [Cytophagales bacterium]|nr:lamin tail domain-containing protein [Cytophagales bacterium]
MHRLSFYLGLLLCSFIALSQVDDSFDDGDFTSGTVWSGDDIEFQVSSGELQLFDDKTDDSHLFTASTLINNTTWEFLFRWEGFSSTGLSGSNEVFFYLVADQNSTPESGNISGYIVRIGNTQDEISFYREDNGSLTELIDGAAGGTENVTESSSGSIRVQVTRDGSGNWILSADVSGGTTFTQIGAVTDDTYISSAFAGIFIDYSSGNADGYFFDDISIAAAPDTDPPTIVSGTGNSTTEVVIDFSENVDQTTAETTSNYIFDNGVSVSNAERSTTDNSQVTLTVATLTNGTSYSVTINNVEDENSNVIATDSETSFEYIEFATAGFRDVVINELLIDETPSRGLPEAEFIELYNPTNQYFNLENWGISDDNSPSASEQFGAFTLRPNSYVIISDDEDEGLFTDFGDVIVVTNLGALTNSGDDVVLSDASGTIIDNLTYTSAPADGTTLEQVNPELPCNGQLNFAESGATDGGTPGAQNSVYDITPDAVAPTVSSVTTTGTTTIRATFSEPLESSSVTTASFGLSGFTIASVDFASDLVVDVTVNTDLVSETTYTLTYSGITDCSGNALSDVSTAFYYDITPPVLDKLVLATDQSVFLVFNEPLNESIAEDESNYMMDQSIGEPESAILQDSAANRVLLAFETDFEEGTSYTLTYDNLADTSNNELAATNEAFTFQDQIDSVYAVSSNILQITFTTTPSSSSATNTLHYLLEDVGNPSSVLTGSDDKTFRLVFAAAMDDNQDLLLYVENVLTSDDAETLATPAFSFRYDTNNPSLESLTVGSATQLKLVFNEALETNSATNLNNYELENDEMPITATLDEATVTLTFADEFEPEQEKTLTYTQIGDLYGNVFTTNRNVDFTYDTQAPSVDSIYQVSDTQVIIRASEQLSLASVSAANFSTDLQSAISFELRGPDSVDLELTFAAALAENEALDLTIAAWQDQSGNSLSAAIETTVNTLTPRISGVQFTTDSTVQITYSKSMSAAAYEASNYALGELTIETVTDIGTNTAEIEIEGVISETTYALSLSNITSDAGNSLQFTSLDLTFETYLTAVNILNALTIDLQFETEFTDFLSANGEVNGENPDLISIDPDDATRIQLLLSEALPENSEVNLYWTNISDRFGRSLPDHTETFSYDVQSPSLSQVDSKLENIIQVIFDEPIESQAASSIIQYSITGIGNPQSLTFINDSTVQLTFTALVSGTDYDLTVEDIADLNENFTASNTLSFTYSPPEIITENLVVISEIMADPSPVVGLPEAEYIEVLNTSDRTLDLASLRLSNDTDTLRLEAYELASGASVALIDAGDADLFAAYNVLEVNGLFSLDNAGELLVLSNINDELVDSLTFSSDWYGDDAKDDGGYSLELIEALSDCSNESNWAASDDTSGGTPGAANSLVPETDPPTIAASSLEEQTITLTFSEEMNESTIVSSAFSITNGLTIATLTPSSESATITFSGDLDTGQTFDLEISDLTDCRGNAMGNTTLTFTIPAIPQSGDLRINEIMADPSPVVGLPEIEYIELLNVSDSIIDLQGLILSKESSSTTLTSYLLGSNEQVAIVDDSNLDLMTDFNAIGVSDLISFSNNADSIVLKDADDQIIDRVEYQSSWYGDEARDDGGYSLELIDPESSCTDENNWAASDDTSGGTPGTANSLVPETDPPTVLSSLLAERTITLTFSEEMNESTIVSSAFSITNGLTISTVTPSSESATITFSGDLDTGQTLDLEISDLTDCIGNAIVDTTITLTIPAIPQPGDLRINEIMADPSPLVGLPEIEYIEILNVSDSIIDLQGLILSKESTSTTLTSYLLGSNEQVAIVDDSNLDLMTGFTAIGVSDLISLSNNADSIVLKDADDQIIDRVEYQSSWYGDEDRDDGGYSLELIDPESSCTDENNWAASDNTSGGTPGAANSLVPETDPPTVASNSLEEQTITLTFSEEMNESTIVSSAFSITNGLTIATVTPSSGSATITFSGDLDSGQTFDLEISDLTDCIGNAIVDTTITLTIPAIPQPGDLRINEIMADPSPVVGLPEIEYIEILNVSDSIIDLQGLVLSKESSSTTLGTYLLGSNEQVAIVDESNLDLMTGFTVIGVSDLISFSNNADSIVLKDADDQIIDRVEYQSSWYGDEDRDDGGYSLELIDPESSCADENNWAASDDTSGGTPGEANSLVPETDPPTVASNSLEEQTITLTFSEEMNESTIVSSAFSITNGLTIATVTPSSGSATITFSGDLDSGQTFDLEISDLTDCIGNAIVDTTITLTIPAIPQPGDLRINEIMADPSPVVGLPEIEYIEILNVSDSIIDLQGLVLSKESSSTTLGTYLLGSNEQVAIVDESNLDLMTGFTVIGVSDLISFSNNADSIVLKDADDQIIDRVEYQSSWYGDEDRDDGGYSLELIDPESSCAEENNWAASDDTSGGTPGEANSLVPETDPPTIAASSLEEQTITLTFSEEMNESTIVSSAFSITNGLAIATVTPSSESATITFTGDLDTGQTFDLEISGLTDCIGNAIVDTTITLTIPAIPQPGDLRINEIMADPSPVVGLPEIEYIEILNVSDSIIDLQGLVLSKESSSTTLGTYLLGSNEQVAIVDENNLDLMTDFTAIGVSDLISFSNNADSIVLKDADDQIIDRVEYQSSWYGDEAKDDGGYSLELIDPESSCTDENNWAASEDTSGGTPGSANSLVPETDPPTVASSSLAEQTITLTFSEEMNESTMVSSAFSITNGLTIATVTPASESVTITFSGDLDTGQTFDLEISGLTDCRGNAMADVSLTFTIPAIPQPGDLRINEIMADPSPVVGLPEIEYIELLNISDSIIDLQGLILSKESSSTTIGTYLLGSNEQVAIVDENNLDLMTGFTTIGVSDLISFSNNADSIVLKDADDQIIDRVEYQSSWYGDETRDDGGYSLELIDPESSCTDENNWAASEDTSGGTPGSANSLVPETDPPTVASRSLEDETITLTFSEEMNESTIVSGAFTISNGLTIATVTPASESATITFSGELDMGQMFDLEISGLTDCRGNAMADTMLTFTIPAIPQPGDLRINEIMADPSPVVGLPEIEYIELLNVSDSIIDLQGLILSKESSSTTIGTYLLGSNEQVVIVDESNLDLMTGFTAIGVSELISFSNNADSIVLKDADDQVIDRVEYQSSWYGDETRDDGGYSLELIDPESSCTDENNWAASEDTSGGTPGSANSLVPETDPPTVASSSLEDETITLTFSEEMNESTIVSGAFTISNGLAIAMVTPLGESATITFSGDLDTGQMFDLEISGLTDCRGNAMADVSLTFTIPAIPQPGDLRINEIMADPSPVVGLPEIEYIELLNISDSIIDLQGLILSKESSSTTIGTYLLGSNEQVAIVDENNLDLMTGFTTIGVSDLISFSNNADSIVLKDADDQIIDRVEYQSSWYGDETRDDGGYSLELIDPESSCTDENNWAASEDTSGGTPGLANSLVPETDPPTVASSSLEDETITLTFSEEMNESTMVSSAFSITNGLTIATVTPASESVTITFSGELDMGQMFDLEISGLTDCRGNAMADTMLTFTIPAIPQPGDLRINEIMADPSPVVGLPEIEYIELLNVSDSIIDLQGLILSKESSSTTIGTYLLGSNEQVVIVDESNLDLMTGFTAIGVSELISFSNNADSIVLKDADDQIIDRVEYQSSWYGDETRDDGGYSLELIDPESSCTDENNWAASEDTSGGTPGSANSLVPETDPPTVASRSLEDETITLTFSEEMNESTIVSGAFTISNGLTIATVTPASESVTITFSGDLDMGQTFDLEISGLTDCRGNAMADVSLSFTIPAIPQPGDLRINEIMADPSPVVGLPEIEYIELLNVSDSIIDLQGLILSKESSSTTIGTYLLGSNEQVAIVDENNLDLMTGFTTIGVSDLISFSNNADSIVLKDADDQIIDRVEYQSSWYGDETRDDGGYSLELIDPESSCTDENNWAASEDTSGGTPGLANSLVPETDPPTVASSSLEDETITLTFSEEMNESTMVSSAFSITNGLTIATVTPASESVTITFSGELDMGQMFDLEISGLTDCRGNAMVDITLTFTIAAAPQPGDLIINEIMADPSPAVGLPEVEYIELFNASDSIVDLQGLILSKANATSTLETYFLKSNEYVAIVDESDLDLMSGFNVVGVSDLISFTNDEDSVVLRTSGNLVIDQIHYEDSWYGDPDRDGGGYSLELIDRNSACSPANSWGASTSEIGGTPGMANNITVETEKPTIVESIFSSGQLTITFSEEMLAASVLDFAAGQAAIIEASSYDETLKELQLTFNEETSALQQIDFAVSNIADCSGNVMNDTTFVFLQAIAPTFNDIIITEIMSDPDPEVGLPNREYLEIFNRSEGILDLNEMLIQDGSGFSAPIGGAILPGEYQVLVSTSGIADFSGVNVNGVGSFPGLSNSGEQLSLIYRGELIFQIDYLADWHDTDKSDGGYSLEMRDTNNPCGISNNWGSSIAEAGGTPGLTNSIREDIPDNFGPNLINAIAINADSILVEFDEALIPTLKPVIEISGGIEVGNTTIVEGDLTSVTLSLNQPLERGVVYTVTAVLVQDCLGNAVRANTAELVLPFEAEFSQILLSEILFNPLDDGVDFVEVYNTTDQFISLKGWSLGNATQDRIITDDDLIISPQSYLAFTEDVARLQLDFPDAPTENLIEIDDLPTYANDFGDVYLIDALGNDQDSLFYDADFHSDLLRSVDGVTLERISFDAPNGADNWNSAASTVNFGTPGAANSQSLDLSAFNDPVEAEPRVFVPGSGTNSFTTINYEFENAGNFANITLFDQNGRFVKELARGVSLAADGFIRWDGTGVDGGVVRVGYYVVVFEVFNSNGQSEIIKETVVVGRDF